MRRFLIFSGTTEGRELSWKLAELGAKVTVCVATEYGAKEQGCREGIEVLTGRLDQDGMRRLIKEEMPQLLIDATHPYAQEVSANLNAVCKAEGYAYYRLLREESCLQEHMQQVSSTQEAVSFLKEQKGKILLTIGAKELSAYAPLGVERLIARVLPFQSSLEACARISLPPAQIIAMQGPFSTELNVALIRSYDSQWMVTKDGGKSGGFLEKVEAARLTNTKLLVIKRPTEEGQSFDEILALCKNYIENGNV